MKNYSKLFEITSGNIPLHFYQTYFLISTLNTFLLWTYVHSSSTIISDVNSLNVIQPNNIIIHQKKIIYIFHSFSSFIYKPQIIFSSFTRYIWLRFLIHVFNVNCESLEILIGLINDLHNHNTIDSVIIYRGKTRNKY